MYGQTGSGKTYTMSAIYTRAAEDLFLQLGQSIHHGVAVTTSFVEISGNECRDLYDCFRSTQLLTGQDGLVYAFPVVEPRVQSAEELVELIEHATSIRSTAATGVHDASSRSHAVLRIYVRREDSKSEGTLTLVDLAGSERNYETHYMQSREFQKESIAIQQKIMDSDRDKKEANEKDQMSNQFILACRHYNMALACYRYIQKVI